MTNYTSKKTFHVFGVAHTVSNREFNACAYTMKVVNFCEMMHDLGHRVYHYGVEGADVKAYETIDLVSRESLNKSYGYSGDNWKNKQFTHTIDDEHHIEYNKRSLEEISKRMQPFDFAISMFGIASNWALKQLPKEILVVDAGLGHCRAEAPYKVFESHSIMAQNYGRRQLQHPNQTDTVIQNYFKTKEFDFDIEEREKVRKQANGEGYFLVVGRVIYCKGGDTAYSCAKLLGANIKYAGQGSLDDIRVPKDDPNVEFIGHVDIQTRNKLMSGAKGLIINSRYLEPFGGVIVEAMLMGLPAIASCRGSFPENIIHGFNGFIVSDTHAMMTAMMCCAALDPQKIHDYAVDNFDIGHVGLIYDEYFDRILRHKFWGINVTPSLSRVLPSKLFGRNIPGLPKVETQQIAEYTYAFGYFGKERVNVENNALSLIVSPLPPSTEAISEDHREGFNEGYTLHIAETMGFVPKVFDYLPALIVTDSDKQQIEEVIVNSDVIPKPRTAFEAYTTKEFDRWLTLGYDVKRKIKSLHFDLKPDILTYLIERFTPDEIIIHNKGAEKWNIYRYRLDESYNSIGVRYFFDPTNVPKKKVAIWTENKWAMGRIYNGVKKHSKICDIDIIDWAEEDINNDFWTDGYKNYDVISGNAEITNPEWTKRREDIVSKLKPTIHTPLIDHEFYRENLYEFSTMLSGISNETIDNVGKTLSEPKYLILTQPGVDTEIFYDLKRETKKIEKIGYVGKINVKDISRGADDIKRPYWALEIAEHTGCELVEIFGHELNVGSEMFKDIDLVISCSRYEGGPLGLFEAASAGVGILSTNVGNISKLNNIVTMSSVEDAVEKIKKWNNDIDSFNSYSKKVTDEVRNDWSWEKKIGAWDSFFYDNMPQEELDKKVKETNKQNNPSFSGAPAPKGKAVPITDPKIIEQYKQMTGMKL